MMNSQSRQRSNSTEPQSRVEQLVQQLAAAEEDKRKVAKEKDDLQQQFMQQKDRMLETERDTGCVAFISRLMKVDSSHLWLRWKETPEDKSRVRPHSCRNQSGISPPSRNLKTQISKSCEMYGCIIQD
jgi:uncharacterized membrane protein YccC